MFKAKKLVLDSIDAINIPRNSEPSQEFLYYLPKSKYRTKSLKG
jgi:hypothetical protein